MRIELDLKESIEKNASAYFEKSKKARKKLGSLRNAILETEKRLEQMRKKGAAAVQKKPFRKRSREWFEKFHWFETSSNELVIAGRDASTNEVVVKKHASPEDVYFHADIQGAAHCILKAPAKKVSAAGFFSQAFSQKASAGSLGEAASFAAVFSKAWQEKLAAVDVYSASPEQVSKKAPSGEALGAGAFMVYGEREWFRKVALEFSVGLEKKDSVVRVVSGPERAVKSHAFFQVKLKQGNTEKGAIAKELKKIFEAKAREEISLDEITAMLPNGGSEAVLPG